MSSSSQMPTPASDLPSRSLLSGRVVIKQGDLTVEAVDAIVNAANSMLRGGGGVDGAIHRAAGPELLAACRELRRTRYRGGLPTGEAVITPGFRLAARHVIHTVGPVFGQHGGREAELLANCYRNCLLLAAEHAVQTIAFPAISTGAFGYPKELAAAVVASVLTDPASRAAGLSRITLVFRDREDADDFVLAARLPE